MSFTVSESNDGHNGESSEIFLFSHFPVLKKISNLAMIELLNDLIASHDQISIRLWKIAWTYQVQVVEIGDHVHTKKLRVEWKREFSSLEFFFDSPCEC